MPPVERQPFGDVPTPLKAQISRDFQRRGGVLTWGAAMAPARHFGLKGRSAGDRVKRIDEQVARGDHKRKKRSGRPSMFSDDVAASLVETFDEDDTLIYREVAERVGLPKSTVHDYATKRMDFRNLSQKIRPKTSEKNLADRTQKCNRDFKAP